MSERIKETDIIARMGGDEFAVLLTGVYKRETILSVAEKLKQSFEEPFKISGIYCYLSCSVGISVFPVDGDNGSDLLKHSDTALYKSKELGKKNIQYFDKSMREEVLRRSNIERLLRDALTNNEFILYYQPQFNVKTSQIRGFEALVRWESYELGFINPMFFIPVAEETGIIHQLGEWIFKEACRVRKLLEERYAFKGVMSINVSPVQLRGNDFTKLVTDVFEYYKFEPKSIELEITESIFINNYNHSVVILKELQKLGVCISLDDFGTGYSSLSYLKNLPIDVLKIDKSFIKNISEDTVDRKITETIISLVHNLGLEAIAEGVETQEQLNCLLNSECDTYQGYLSGKPMPLDKICEMISINN